VATVIYRPVFFPVKPDSARVCRKPLRIVSSLVLLLAAEAAPALDKVILNISRIESQGFNLEELVLSVSALTHPPHRLSLTAQKLMLPPPFNQIDLINVKCLDFSWGDDEMICRQGQAEIHNDILASPSVTFSFHIRPKRSEFQLDPLRLGGGQMTLEGAQAADGWYLKGRATGIDSRLIRPYLPAAYQLSQGVLSFDFNAQGTALGPEKLGFKASLNKLSGQSLDGRIAAENAGLALSLRLLRQQDQWQWLSRVEFNGGAVYVEPLFLDAAQGPFALNMAGSVDRNFRRADIGYFSFRHPEAAVLNGSGTVVLTPGLFVEQADLALTATDVKTLSTVYLQPFLFGTALQGLLLEGALNADISLHRQALSKIGLSFTNLDIYEGKERFSLKDGAGRIDWAKEESFTRESIIAWRALQVAGIPIGPSGLSFSAKAKTLSLLEKTRLPLLGGYLAIDRFNWKANLDTDPDVHFIGAVESISLAQLTKALDWTPLTGSISGIIPGVDYRDKKLTLAGELTVKVFDGEIKIKDLASSGLFGDFPQVYGDISFDNLDLDALTGKFKVGGIEGRLSGFVHDLHLENWRPMTFYAWLGTPSEDDSRHRISQKAVQNLASIGGGGAAGLLSQTLLRFFDTFGYDRLGLGCYLNRGVCQLMGVAPAQQGYYIVKGGGLPRIDVIGYNTRIDWNVLLKRLERITASDEVLIK